jgi:hypothetical protein
LQLLKVVKDKSFVFIRLVLSGAQDSGVLQNVLVLGGVAKWRNQEFFFPEGGGCYARNFFRREALRQE